MKYPGRMNFTPKKPSKFFMEYLDLNENTKVQLHKKYHETHSHVPKEFLHSNYTHHISAPNEEATRLASWKYDVALDFHADAEAWTKAKHSLIAHLRKFFSNARVLDYDDLKTHWQASPGAIWSNLYPDKRIAWENEEVTIRRYWEVLSKDTCPPVLWLVKMKVELLPNKKLIEQDMRSYINPPIDFSINGARLVKDFNDKMSCHDLCNAAVGFTPYFNGTNKLARVLNIYPIKEEADVSKWDSRLHPKFFELCEEIRWMMFAKEYQTAENKVRLRNYYKNLVDSYLLHPNNEVWVKHIGMPSGAPSTTYDNTLIHMFIHRYIYYLQNPKKTLKDFDERVMLKCYGDDVILSMSEKTSKWYSFSHREKYYTELGLILKPEKCKQQRKLEGLTFLGKKFLYHKYWNTYVGIYDTSKAEASLMWPMKQYTLDEEYTRAVALYMEVFWTDRAEAFRNYALFLKDKGGRIDNTIQFHDLTVMAAISTNPMKVMSLYLGFENT